MAQAASESSKSGTKTPTSSAADEADPQPQPQRYSDLVSTLPARNGWVSLVQYQNYWLNPGRLQHIIPVKDLYKPRPDDILLATSLKCGTTWLKALAFAITTRARHHHAVSNHPLLTLHPQEAVPHLEVHTPGQSLADIETLPSPRLLGTHLPLSLLPPSVVSCRVVYLCRQPKDVFVSLWHFVNGMPRGGGRPPVDMGAALGAFCEGASPFGPVWEHYLEYWRASLARPQRVLFLRYEEMVADPASAVRKLAGFFAVPFTEEEERAGVPEEIVRLCSFETLSGSNRTGDLDCGDNTVIGKATFFRKGEVGDWANHLTEEMAKKVDDVFEEKLKGSGLVF